MKTVMLFLAGMAFNLALLGVAFGAPGVAAIGFLLTAFDLFLAFRFGKESAE